MYVRNMIIAKTELVKQSKPKLITTTAVIKRQRLKEERKTTQQCVIDEEIEVLGVKPLRRPPSN